jgi:hypothetical protein
MGPVVVTAEWHRSCRSTEPMDRDSVFLDKVLWRGTPRVITPTRAHGAMTWGLLAMSAISTAMSVAMASTLHRPVGTMVIFAAWCASFALAIRIGPQIWHMGAEYVVTERFVVWKRGRFRRSIERAGITFARIHWYAGQPGIGDLELVRDVPTGALRRRLTIVLRGVPHPDRVWDFIRGGSAMAADTDAAELPIPQRLVEGERVIWSGRPVSSWRAFLPQGGRDIAAACAGVLAAVAMVRLVPHSLSAAHLVLRAGVPAASVGFVALVVALALTSMLIFAVATMLVWTAIVEPGLEARRTRYLITDRRVLIAQGTEELHLDRSRIVDVVDAAGTHGGRDLFLVLDGPRSRAVAMSGAFDDAPRGLVPVLRRVADADAAEAILLCRQAA